YQHDLAVDRQRLGVQQPSDIFVDPDACGEQIGVVAAAGGADDPGIVARGKDDRRVDTAVGAGADRVVEGVVGNVVGRGDDYLAPGGEQKGLEHLLHRRIAHGRPCPD